MTTIPKSVGVAQRVSKPLAPRPTERDASTREGEVHGRFGGISGAGSAAAVYEPSRTFPTASRPQPYLRPAGRTPSPQHIPSRCPAWLGRGDNSKPLAIDLYCGLGGWTDGLLEEGYDVIGFDIEEHVYGEHRYPGQLVVQDVLTLHGSQFRDAALIVASPPCQEYSYMAMPWKRAKAKAAAIRADETGQALADLNKLFNACFRIQREASFAAGRHIPLVVENVKGAQPWVGRARWAYGSFFLWGDVPALMPIQKYHSRQKVKAGEQWNVNRANFTGTLGWDTGAKNTGGSWFNIAHNTTSGKGQNPDGRKTRGHLNIRDGHTHTRHLTNQAEHEGLKNPGIELGDVGFNVASAHKFGHMVEGVKIKRSEKDIRDHIGTKRKFASAMIARIPAPLSRHIAKAYRPC